jgi:hypothetical protein
MGGNGRNSPPLQGAAKSLQDFFKQAQVGSAEKVHRPFCRPQHGENSLFFVSSIKVYPIPKNHIRIVVSK